MNYEYKLVVPSGKTFYNIETIDKLFEIITTREQLDLGYSVHSLKKALLEYSAIKIGNCLIEKTKRESKISARTQHLINFWETSVAGDFGIMSESTGIHFSTLTRIKRGLTEPREPTYKILCDYFREYKYKPFDYSYSFVRVYL